MKEYLPYVIACVAAAASFLLNRVFLQRFGMQTIITLSPVAEEMLKTLTAYSVDADILITHVVFGLIEAVYDWLQTRGRLMAAFFSVGGHSLFGFVTVLTTQAAGINIGLAAGIVAHLLWNTIMVKLLPGKAK